MHSVTKFLAMDKNAVPVITMGGQPCRACSSNAEAFLEASADSPDPVQPWVAKGPRQVIEFHRRHPARSGLKVRDPLAPPFLRKGAFVRCPGGYPWTLLCEGRRAYGRWTFRQGCSSQGSVSLRSLLNDQRGKSLNHNNENIRNGGRLRVVSHCSLAHWHP